jgi:prolyl 4-hydroxylase
MAMIVNLPVQLRDWITESVARGVPPAAMVEGLVARNLERGIARRVIDAFVSAHAAPRSLPAHDGALDVKGSLFVPETPRIAPGHVIRAGDRGIRVLQRLQSPVIVMLESVLTAEECEQLIGMAQPRLQRSTVVDGSSGANVAVERRSSDGMFFRLRENPFIARLDERLAALMNGPAENSEGLQVLRYVPGGQYPPHFDFLVPSNAASAQSIARSGQRISTLIVYLNDVLEGGETVFPEVGLSVVPRRGNGLYFEYTNSGSQVDPRSAHGGARVTRGEKWIVTKWMRSRKFMMAGDSQEEE